MTGEPRAARLDVGPGGGLLAFRGWRHRGIGSLYEATLQYLQHRMQSELPDPLSRRALALASVARHIEHVSAIFATNILSLAEEHQRLGLARDPEAAAKVLELHAAVSQAPTRWGPCGRSTSKLYHFAEGIAKEFVQGFETVRLEDPELTESALRRAP